VSSKRFIDLTRTVIICDVMRFYDYSIRLHIYILLCKCLLCCFQWWIQRACPLVSMKIHIYTLYLQLICESLCGWNELVILRGTGNRISRSATSSLLQFLFTIKPESISMSQRQLTPRTPLDHKTMPAHCVQFKRKSLIVVCFQANRYNREHNSFI